MAQTKRGLVVPPGAASLQLHSIMHQADEDGHRPSDYTAWTVAEQTRAAGASKHSRGSSARDRPEPEVATLAELSAMRYPLTQGYAVVVMGACAHSQVVTGLPTMTCSTSQASSSTLLLLR